jgi:hypothetical protein
MNVLAMRTAAQLVEGLAAARAWSERLPSALLVSAGTPLI